MSNKVCTLQEAVAKYVEDGDSISFGGFTTNKKPMAAVREILRQGKKDLSPGQARPDPTGIC